jgi:hypothetical protein
MARTGFKQPLLPALVPALAGTLVVVVLLAGSPPAGPAFAETAGDPKRVIQLGEASLDTLDAPWKAVLPAAISQLEHDKWRIHGVDRETGRIVTHWKPLKHFLARLILGTVHVRAIVDVTPLGPGRTQLSIRGSLASDDEIENNPSLDTARKTYAKAARKWLRGVRRQVEASQASVDARPSSS